MAKTNVSMLQFSSKQQLQDSNFQLLTLRFILLQPSVEMESYLPYEK